MTIIQCERLSKTIGNHNALQNITCAIESEKIVGIIGRNGAGKSTLLNILAGYLQPTQGTCRILGENPFNNLQTAANTVMIDDRLSFSNYLTLEEVLTMGDDFYPNWHAELAFRLLNYAGLARKANHQQLSKGQLATFNLIYGLASRCALTILDEPMNGMDEAIRSDFYRAILKEYIAFPRTIIIAGHHLQEMESILEEIILIDEGAIVAHASVDELKQQLISLTGPSDALTPLLANLVIYAKKEIAGQISVVVDASNLFILEEELQERGITTNHLSTSEVCMYLTRKEGSDIDAVFD
ncbi:ATP-binding cassette domain-containing protein [Lysinibacillus sp. NPDC096418]|uniref:ATP-binding cassette domain-containing protein n=1 Tax=Lysinibacillus sp. NPDC096418 TaxID=3364138 RepID=UPI0037F8224A